MQENAAKNLNQDTSSSPDYFIWFVIPATMNLMRTQKIIFLNSENRHRNRQKVIMRRNIATQFILSGEDVRGMKST